jgi:hypothetical protein
MAIFYLSLNVKKYQFNAQHITKQTDNVYLAYKNIIYKMVYAYIQDFLMIIVFGMRVLIVLDVKLDII